MKYSLTERKKWLTHHDKNGGNVSATCRKFGISRATFYRWLNRYDSEKPRKSLTYQSRRPKNTRKPRYSTHHLYALADLMVKNPRWGRTKLHAALVTGGWHVSIATVGRMIGIVNHRCPVCGGRRNHDSIKHVMDPLFRKTLREIGVDYLLDKRRVRNPRSVSTPESKRAVDEVERIIREDP